MYTEQLSRVTEPVVSGTIAEIDEAYTREVPVSWFILIPVFLLAALGTLPVLLISVLRGGPATGGEGRTLKQLRTGPEIAVTPMLLRDEDGRIVDLEVHGYVRSDRLLRNDRLRIEVRDQRRLDLPQRAVRIHNHTTGQIIRPHPHTVLSHLGLPMILRASIGLILAGLMTVAWFAGG